MKRLFRQRRIAVVTFIILLFFCLLWGRLFQLQIADGEELARAAVIQRSLRFILGTGRGQILDRYGNSLLDTEWEPVLVSFGSQLPEETRQALQQPGYRAGSNAIQVIRGLDRQTVAGLQKRNLPGVLLGWEERRYGQNSLASHITGYVQRQEIFRTRPNYTEVSFRAVSGLERTFDRYLAADRLPVLAAITDARGRQLEGLGYRLWRDEDLRRPYHVITTIDSGLQAVVEEVGKVEIKSGAAVIMEPQSGDILAMASFPEVKPQRMLEGITREEFQLLYEDPASPFINKAIQKYPPGSVFKVVLAAAALEKNGAQLPAVYYCTGSIAVGDTTVSCYNETAHGPVDLHRALAVSCNCYFIQLGQRLGRSAIIDTAEGFMLNRAAGIGLGNESAGRIPAARDLPYLGNLAHTSIGQGLVEITPLQMARLMAIIANNGRDVQPRLAAMVIDNDGNTIVRYPKKIGRNVISPLAARRLKSLLQGPVEPQGTARSANSPLYTVAGKSGTAETAQDHSHSWFAGIITIDNKTYAAAVFIQDRNIGTAADAFREIMETYARRRDR